MNPNDNFVKQLKAKDFENNILENLLSMAHEISELRIDNLTNIDLICSYQKEIDEIELPIILQVEKESETKEDKSLSTKEKRENEAEKRLNANLQYKDKIKKIKDLKLTNSKNDILISYNRRVISIYLVFGKVE
jgi:hypothetical protein